MQIFKTLLEKLLDKDNASLKMSIKNCHVKGMFSLVVAGTEFGSLTRVFIAKKEVKPFEVQLHSHRYPIKITVLKGDITHHQAQKDSNGVVNISEYSYESFLTGGKGLEYIAETKVNCFDHKLPIGSVVSLKAHDYHTISCSENSIWIVEELGYETQKSRVLGVPFVVSELYSTPDMSEIDDKRQMLIRELKKIKENYDLVG